MDNYSRIITAGVGPIIVISACGLLCLAFYNRLAAVVTRLRAFHRERLHAHEALNHARKENPADETAAVMHHELLGMLETQTRHVTRRAKLIRGALTCLLATIGCLAICSLALGLSTFWPGLMCVAAVMFIVGLVLLIAAIVFALVEIRHALDPIELESRFVREMVEQLEHL
jgi:ABC-type nickel/cobalt efflux system permease component RcnA